MMSKTKPQENTMTEKGTVQLSMNVDPDLKKEIRIAALNKGMTMTEWILKWVKVGLNETKKE